MKNLAPSATPDSLGQSLIKHQAFIRRVARALTRDSHEADDLVQDTWVRALTSRPHTEGGLGAWLAASARGLAHNGRRAANRRRLHEGVAGGTRAAKTTKDAMEELAVRQEVLAAVLALDEPFKSTVVMVYERGLKPSEIAKQEGIAVTTVRTRLFRAHDRLREKLSESHVDRSRLAALAALPQWAHGKPSPALPMKGLLFGASALVLGAAAVHWSVPERGLPELTGTSAARDAVAADLPDVSLVVLNEETGRVGASAQDANSGAPSDHPYWVAVRAARGGLERYSLETKENAALWAALAVKPTQALELPAQVGLRACLASFEKALGSPLQLSDEALEEIDPENFSLEWLVPSAKMTLEESLSLMVMCIGCGELSWEVADGAVHVDTTSGLGRYALAFEYGLGDLLLEPADFFKGRKVPYPIYSSTMNKRDLSVLCSDRDPRLEIMDEDPGAESPSTSMTLMGTPRAHRETQRFLDAIRRFQQPLPEDGISGETLRFPVAQKKDQRVLAELRRLGGWQSLQPKAGETLRSSLEAFAAKANVGVLWTAAARDEDVEFGELSFNVAFGCLFAGASAAPGPLGQAEMWFDLRTHLTGQEFHVEGIAEPLVLTTRGLDNFIYDHMGGDSWDNNPDCSIRVTEDDCLVIRQSLPVLEEIAILVDAIRARDD